MHCHYFALSKYLRFFRKYTFLVFFRLIPMTMFFGHNADCFCFFLLLHLMLDIFQIHWYFGSARCKKHEQQKQYVFVALLQTPHKVLCKNQNGRFRGWFIEISMNYTLVCVLNCWAFCEIVTLSAENKVDLIAANMSSNQGSLPGNVYNVHLGLHQINGSVDKDTFHISFWWNAKIVKKSDCLFR